MSVYVSPKHVIPGSFKSFIRRWPLPAFFVLAFGLTWPLLIADALGSHGLLPFRLAVSGPGIVVTVLVVGYGPTLAALIVTGITDGKVGVRALLGRLLIWRVGWRWYAAAIFIPAALQLVAIMLALLVGGSWPTLPMPLLPLLLNAILLFVVQGVINGEEIGWRGFALPTLQANRSALSSSLILAVVTGLFHLPLFFTQGGGAGGNLSSESMFGYLTALIGISILFTWIYNNSRGSLLLVYLFHAAFNTWTQVFESDTPGTSLSWLRAGSICLAAVIVVLLYGPARLKRKSMSD
jgi:membrane protease YdiL (CAAX protease family)